MKVDAISTPRGATPVSQEHAFSLAYAWYAVVVLMLCYTLSFVDRQILSLLVGPIKRELSISDTRVGLLQGLAFALFYTFLGLPIGRVADRWNRRNLISLGIFVWSLMTALCSAARSFASLFLARIGVGVGEATLSPAAFSLIADYFPKEQLGLAMSVYSMGIFIGSGLALILGGLVVDSVSRLNMVSVPILGTITSWRVAFLAVGLPGLVFVLLVRTVKEPARRALLKMGTQSAGLPLRDVFAQIRLRRWSMVGISFGMIFQSMCTYAFMAWAPTFLQRVHGWTSGESGRLLGILVVSCCCLGMYTGGMLSDRWQRNTRPDGPLRVAAYAAIGTGVFFPAAMIASDVRISAALFAPGLFCMALPIGCVFASLQLIFPNQVRGQVSAVMLFFLNLGGLSLGPLLPGVFNDYFFHNEKMIGASVALTIGLASALQFIIFITTFRSYRHDYATMQSRLADGA
jgi:MFS family permease